MTAGNTHRIKVAEQLEAGLSPEKLEIWKVVHAQLPGATDWGIELYLLNAILGGASAAELAMYIPKKVIRGSDRRQLDRRELQAGERL